MKLIGSIFLALAAVVFVINIVDPGTALPGISLACFAIGAIAFGLSWIFGLSKRVEKLEKKSRRPHEAAKRLQIAIVFTLLFQTSLFAGQPEETKQAAWESAKRNALSMDKYARKMKHYEELMAKMNGMYKEEYAENKKYYIEAKERLDAAKKAHGFTDAEINAAIANEVDAREKKRLEDLAKFQRDQAAREAAGRTKASERQPAKARTGD